MDIPKRMTAGEAVKKEIKAPQIICGDCLKVMKDMEAESINLLITSPPYYNARDYSTWKNLEAYLENMKQIFAETYRLMKQGHVIVVNIGDIIGQTNGSPASRRRIPLMAYFVKILEEIGFIFLEDFIWYKGEVTSKRHLAGRAYPFQKYPINSYEHLLVFAKKDTREFYRCPRCGNANLLKRGWQSGTRIYQCKNEHCRGVIENQAKTGHACYTFSRKSELQRQYEVPENEIPPELLKFWRKDVAKFHPTAANRKAKNGLVGHSAPFPEKIPEFALTFYSGVGDLVLDPFVGSGTSGVVAKKMSRNFIGIELHEEYCRLARSRIETKKVEDLNE